MKKLLLSLAALAFKYGLTGKLMLPLLRPGRRNKSLSVARIIQRVVEYLHEHWPNTVIELRDSQNPSALRSGTDGLVSASTLLRQ